ncbi:MAG TPA: hypothetical protein VFI11_04395 [Anaerolineales bacterium]|nr:hypothetical protein [Anaerolineales bacterium]
MNSRQAGALALFFAAASAAASLFVSSSVFERMPHVEDEFAFLWQAEMMGRGRLWIESPPQPESFLVPFVVDHDGKRFGKYPPGWPATLSLGAAAGAPHLVNALLVGLAVWWTYRLAARLAGHGPGALAALLTATSPMLLMLSGSLMSHLLTMLLAVVWTCAWLDLSAGDTGAGRVPVGMLIFVAGLSLGLMALTRPLTALAVALPFGVHGAFLVIRGHRSVRLHLAAVAILALLVGGLLFVWQWEVTGDPLLNPYSLWWSYDRVGFGPGIGPMPEGHSFALAVNNTRHSLNAWLHDLFGWPYLSWILIPAGLFALRRRPEAWLMVSVFASLVVTYMAYWVGSWLLGPRYFVEALPALAAVSAAGARAIAGRFPRAGARRAAPVIALAVLLAINLFIYLPIRLGGLRGLYGITRARMAPLERAHLGSALVIVHPVPDWTSYGALLLLTDPFRDEGPLFLAYSKGPDQDRRLMAAFPERVVYHYYTNDPWRVHLQPPEE